MKNNSIKIYPPIYKDKVLWITLCFYLIAFTDFVSDYIPVSISKVIIYTIAIALIWGYSKKEKSKFFRIQLVRYVVIPYLILLLIRLVFDFVLMGKGFSIYGNSYTIIYFYLNALLIPVLFYSRYKIDLNIVSFCMLSACVMSICFLISIDKIIVESVASVTTGGQYDAGGHLDIISYGQYSCALSLIGTYLLFFYGRNKKLLLFSIIFIAVGITGIVLSAARSAFVGLFIGVGYLYICRFGNLKRIIIAIIALILLSNFFSSEIISFNDFLAENGFNGFNRIVETFFDKDSNILNQTNNRDYLYKMGFSLFLQNPIFGNSYLLPNGTYVHNIFIEQLMALGLIGGALFLYMNCALLKYSFIIAKHCPKYSVFSVLFIQNLIYGCFSMTVIGLTAYWLFAALIINTYTNYKYEKRICNNPDI